MKPADTSRPSRQVIDTVRPPRARSPLTRPDDHAAGSDGSSSISGTRSVEPSVGERVRLEEHLRNGRRASQVAVDLKRRMRIEQVGIRPLRTEERAQDLVRAVTVLQARPQVETPSDGPAGGEVAALLEPPAHRAGQLRRSAQRDLAGRIEAIQMRDVTVLLIGCRRIPVFEPLLQLTLRADAVRREPVPCGSDTARVATSSVQLAIAAQLFPGRQRGLISRRAGSERSL